jgi:hypothetical protein
MQPDLRVFNPLNYIYLLNGQQLESVKSINDLGMVLDEKLNFDEHVSRARRMLGFIM